MTNQVAQADGPMRGADSHHDLNPSPYKEMKAKVEYLEERLAKMTEARNEWRTLYEMAEKALRQCRGLK